MPITHNMSLLAVDIGKYMSNTDSIGKKLADSGIMILLGLATVFSVLIIIWAVLVLFRIFMYDIPNRRKASKAEPVADTAEAQTVIEEPVTDAADDTEIIAVITAAIAASEGKNPSSLRVVSFRRSGAPRWNER